MTDSSPPAFPQVEPWADVKMALRCNRFGGGHYCPNCDNGLDHIAGLIDVARASDAATLRQVREELERVKRESEYAKTYDLTIQRDYWSDKYKDAQASLGQVREENARLRDDVNMETSIANQRLERLDEYDAVVVSLRQRAEHAEAALARLTEEHARLLTSIQGPLPVSEKP